ncbi:glycosyltransferase family 4 protein, partial [Neobacillus vireti]|uniref:glycosyltransferase family 4 protein n=1 Tax=Neobacillus vireti TaxID=220686 RepID=UPI002FFFA0E4
IFNRLYYYLEIALKMILLILKDKKKYDYVFATSPPIFTGFVGLFAKYRYRSGFILDVRDLWPESLKGVGVFNYPFVLSVFGALEKILYKKANKIVINSFAFKKYIQEKAAIAPEKILFIPNGAVKEELATLPQKDHSDKRIIYAGNLGLAQDTEFINHLVPHLNEQGIKLTVIGYGINKKHLVDSIKQYKNVTVVNPMTRKAVFKIIAEHDLGLVTLKDKEVFKTVLPGKIIDYLTCGVPVIGVIDGYSKQIVERERVGIAINGNDPEQMLKSINELLANQSLRNEMSQRAQQLILEEFNWDKNIEKLVEYMR